LVNVPVIHLHLESVKGIENIRFSENVKKVTLNISKSRFNRQKFFDRLFLESQVNTIDAIQESNLNWHGKYPWRRGTVTSETIRYVRF
jgi:hypothetical protein